MKSRYSRWDGTQDPMRGDLDVGEILDELADDLLSGFGADGALQDLISRGISGRLQGLDQLRERVRQRRVQASEALNLEGPLKEVQEELGEILAQERSTLSGTEGDTARLKEATLDNLPSHPAAALKDLREYSFEDPQAAERFQKLLEKIQQEILSSYFGHLSGAISSINREDLALMNEMLKDLNAMIAARDRGDEYDFAGFMEKYGSLFPENPKTLDQLLEVLARRMAAMSRLLASLSPQQRRQLQDLANSVLEDLDIAFHMDMLGQQLRDLMPNLPWDESVTGWGEGDMQLPTALDAIDRISELEELEETIGGNYPGARLEDIDEEKLLSHLGEEAVTDIKRLREIEKVLEEAGLVARTDGRLELTARGARRLGERALVKVFEELKRERAGAHEARDPGGQAEATGATKPWHFGDVGQVAVQRSVFNAVVRSGGGASLKLKPEDFELVEAESRTQTATALLLDLSYSMPLRGHWTHAKRMALALHALIESKYPSDQLYLIGFSDYARRLQPEELTVSETLERVYGTNMQHAFLLARRLLADHPRASKQVIMVTDGEPTAHLVDGGETHGPYAQFAWPPTPETIQKTLTEALRLSGSGVTLNIFMLENEPGLIRFTERLAGLTGGRVFLTASKGLDNLVIRDYVRNRT